MSIKDKWINTTFKIATGKPLLRNIITPIGAIVFFSFVTGLVLLSVLLDKALEFKPFIGFPFDLILGFLFLFPGLIITVSCVFYFIKAKGTPVPMNPPKKLITDGPYKISRNPMVTGIFLVLFGIGFIINSISLTFVITPVFVLLNFLELKNIEEPELEKRIGNEYTEYKKKVPMFIPKLFSKKTG